MEALPKSYCTHCHLFMHHTKIKSIRCAFFRYNFVPAVSVKLVMDKTKIYQVIGIFTIFTTFTLERNMFVGVAIWWQWRICCLIIFYFLDSVQCARACFRNARNRRQGKTHTQPSQSLHVLNLTSSQIERDSVICVFAVRNNIGRCTRKQNVCRLWIFHFSPS